jgi:hypothetical protein
MSSLSTAMNCVNRFKSQSLLSSLLLSLVLLLLFLEAFFDFLLTGSLTGLGACLQNLSPSLRYSVYYACMHSVYNMRGSMHCDQHYVYCKRIYIYIYISLKRALCCMSVWLPLTAKKNSIKYCISLAHVKLFASVRVSQSVATKTPLLYFPFRSMNVITMCMLMHICMCTCYIHSTYTWQSSVLNCRTCPSYSNPVGPTPYSNFCRIKYIAQCSKLHACGQMESLYTASTWTLLKCAHSAFWYVQT